MSSMGDAIQIVDILRDHEKSLIAAQRKAWIQSVPPEKRREEFQKGQPPFGYHSGVEIGVHRGDTSAALLRAFPSLSLAMVDPWATYAADHPYRLSGDGCARMTQAEQDANRDAARAATDFARDRRRIYKMTSERAAGIVPWRKASFVFVDGDHTLEAVRRDIELWWPRIEPGGMLLGHDFGHPRDQRGVWGVTQAVGEFVEREGVAVATLGTIWFCIKGAAAPKESESDGRQDQKQEEEEISDSGDGAGDPINISRGRPDPAM